MNKCEKCGFLHYRTDPCRVAKKSTAARMDVQKLEGSTTSSDAAKKRSGDTGNARLGDGLSEASKLAEIAQSGPAGTQALPVDTLKPSPEWYAGIDALTGHEPPPQNPKFDKKAWQREYMRDYMRKRRAALKS